MKKHEVQVKLDKHPFLIVKLFHELQVLNPNFVVLVSRNRPKMNMKKMKKQILLL